MQPQLVRVPKQENGFPGIDEMLSYTLSQIGKLAVIPVIEWPDEKQMMVDAFTPIERRAMEFLAQAELSGDTFGKTRQGLMNALGIRDREVDSLIDCLVRKEFLVKQYFRTSPNGRSVFLRFTTKTIEELERLGINGLRKNVDHVSEPHYACVQVIAQFYAAEECRVEQEVSMEVSGGRTFRADAVVEYPSGEKTIVEVVLSNEPSDIRGLIEGIRTHLLQSNCYLILVFETKEEADSVEKYLKDTCPEFMNELGQQIQFRCAYRFFESVWARKMPYKKAKMKAKKDTSP